jgi:hypothetical protein
MAGDFVLPVMPFLEGSASTTIKQQRTRAAITTITSNQTDLLDVTQTESLNRKG